MFSRQNSKRSPRSLWEFPEFPALFPEFPAFPAEFLEYEKQTLKQLRANNCVPGDDLTSVSSKINEGFSADYLEHEKTSWGSAGSRKSSNSWQRTRK